jgi:hypothetical protein
MRSALRQKWVSHPTSPSSASRTRCLRSAFWASADSCEKPGVMAIIASTYSSAC